ncbi:histidine kinase [Paenibacillus durus ATCC 35681]|uniref:histidine kinase n=1 Tax=Paenibacillus durus ATCC 35681 TaxID=1333534 RepID=A0A0F7F9P9_PAEDU|nr:sensor histidine kinase [Paenibacillus durus]AKG34834.1 histidine kinase [Paenibacillus durus ATCC 35681]
MKTNIAALVLMLIAVPLAGELKFFPFQDEFRVSMAIPVFFFFLLWIQRIPPALSGLLVGIFVVAFRIGWDSFVQADVSIGALYLKHFPVFFYYLAYAGLFQLLRLNQLPYRPVRVGVLSILVEIIANLVEFSVRHLHSMGQMNVEVVGKLLLIAVIRSFFVLGFFNLIQLRQSVLAEEQQRKEKERILLLVSNLYEESVQLKKTLQFAEDITRDCYELYRQLQQVHSLDELDPLARKALSLSGQVHEIKKDNQRIYAGLSKLIADEGPSDYMDPLDIARLIVRTNDKYAAALGKTIQFSIRVNGTFPPLHVYTLLSLMNNLAANAVEAIPKEGAIAIRVRRADDRIDIQVSDNGPGIPDRKKKLVFTPGYTSKYDISGKPSTGMGLYYIREVVQELQGDIELQDDPETGETVFTLLLPIDPLTQKG